MSALLRRLGLNPEASARRFLRAPRHLRHTRRIKKPVLHSVPRLFQRVYVRLLAPSRSFPSLDPRERPRWQPQSATSRGVHGDPETRRPGVGRAWRARGARSSYARDASRAAPALGEMAGGQGGMVAVCAPPASSSELSSRRVDQFGLPLLWERTPRATGTRDLRATFGECSREGYPKSSGWRLLSLARCMFV